MLDDTDDDETQGAEIAVLPLTSTSNDTDGDSANKESLCSGRPKFGNSNNLNRNQLVADASLM